MVNEVSLLPATAIDDASPGAAHHDMSILSSGRRRPRFKARRACSGSTSRLLDASSSTSGPNPVRRRRSLGELVAPSPAPATSAGRSEAAPRRAARADGIPTCVSRSTGRLPRGDVRCIRLSIARRGQPDSRISISRDAARNTDGLIYILRSRAARAGTGSAAPGRLLGFTRSEALNYGRPRHWPRRAGRSMSLTTRSQKGSAHRQTVWARNQPCPNSLPRPDRGCCR